MKQAKATKRTTKRKAKNMQTTIEPINDPSSTLFKFFDQSKPAKNDSQFEAYHEYLSGTYTHTTGTATMGFRDWKSEGSPSAAQWAARLGPPRQVVKTDDEGNEIVKEPKLKKDGTPRAARMPKSAVPKAPKSNVTLLVAPKSTGKKRIPAMFAEGIIKAGDVLTIANHADSSATVIDGKLVRFGNDELTFNAWGEQITGHVAVNIYIHAMLADGRFLNELRG